MNKRESTVERHKFHDILYYYDHELERVEYIIRVHYPDFIPVISKNSKFCYFPIVYDSHIVIGKGQIQLNRKFIRRKECLTGYISDIIEEIHLDNIEFIYNDIAPKFQQSLQKMIWECI